MSAQNKKQNKTNTKKKMASIVPWDLHRNGTLYSRRTSANEWEAVGSCATLW